MFSSLLILALGAPGELRLADLLEEARQRNPEIVAARAEARASVAEASSADALDDPMLMVQLWNAPVDFAIVPIMIQLSQSIPLGNKLGLRRNVAEAQAQGARSTAAARVRDIETAVAGAYFDLFLADRTIDISQEIEQTLRTLLSAASSRVEAGKGEVVEELKAEAELLKIQVQAETARAQRTSAGAKLAALLDREPEEITGRATRPAFLVSLLAEPELRERALSNRPELKAAADAVAVAQAQVGLARAARVPDLGVSLAEMHVWGAPSGQTDFLFAGLQWNLPIFESGKTGPRVEAATDRLLAAHAMASALRNRVLAELAEAYARVVAEQHLVELHHKLIPVTRRALESALSSYAAGRIDFMAVVDSERELQMHQLDLAMHLAGYEQDVAALEHAVGVDLGLAAASEAGTHEEGHQ